MTWLTRRITAIDIFGQGIQLRIDNQIKAKTLLGGVLSLLMIIALSAMFFISANDVLYKENPQIITEGLVMSPVQEVVLNTTTFSIGISLTNDGNLPLNHPRYFHFEVRLRYGNTLDTDLKEAKLEMVNCTKDKFPLVPDKNYDGLTMDHRMCIKDQNITVHGSWGDLQITYLKVILFLCKNSTEDSGECAPIEEIESFLQKGDIYMNLYVMDTIYNPKNYSTPITYSLLNLYKKVKLDSTKISEVYIKNQTLLTDDGFLFPNSKTVTGVSVERTEFDDGTFNPSDSRLVVFDIYAANTKYNIYRKYPKIQEVLASVGGLANIVIIALTVICYIFSVVKRDILIQNKIFDYDLNIKSGEHIIKDLDVIFQESERRKGISLDHASESVREASKDTVTNSKGTNLVKYKKSSKSLGNDTTFTNERVVYRSSNQQINIDEISQGPSQSKPNNGSHRIGNFEMNMKRRNISKNFVRKKDSDQNIYKQMDKKVVKFLDVSDDKSDHSGMQMNQSTKYNNIHIPEHTHQKNSFTSPKQFLNILNARRKRYELKFSFCEIIRAFICCDNCSNRDIIFKKSLYKKSNFVVDEFLDITNIIQKLDEFEKLKIVILNSEQLALFNFIAKEFISLDEDKISSHYMTKFKQLNKDKEQLANLIIEFKQKFGNDGKEIKEIDRKLYNLLNEEFK